MRDSDNATAILRVTQPRRSWGIRAWHRLLRAAIRATLSRRELIGMDDRMLADIGISRGEALTESQRRAWDLETPPDPTRRRRGG